MQNLRKLYSFFTHKPNYFLCPGQIFLSPSNPWVKKKIRAGHYQMKQLKGLDEVIRRAGQPKNIYVPVGTKGGDVKAIRPAPYSWSSCTTKTLVSLNKSIYTFSGGWSKQCQHGIPEIVEVPIVNFPFSVVFFGLKIISGGKVDEFSLTLFFGHLWKDVILQLYIM